MEGRRAPGDDKGLKAAAKRIAACLPVQSRGQRLNPRAAVWQCRAQNCPHWARSSSARNLLQQGSVLPELVNSRCCGQDCVQLVFAVAPISSRPRSSGDGGNGSLSEASSAHCRSSRKITRGRPYLLKTRTKFCIAKRKRFLASTGGRFSSGAAGRQQVYFRQNGREHCTAGAEALEEQVCAIGPGFLSSLKIRCSSSLNALINTW